MVYIDTFRLMHWIPEHVFQHLKNMPGMKLSDGTYKTNYCSRKGVTHIELHTYNYEDKHGDIKEIHFLILGFNANVVMGNSRVQALDLEKYTPAQIAAQVQKRIFEINELRVHGIHKIDVGRWHLDRVDLTYDIKFPAPCLMIRMLNFSFPYIFKMKPFVGTGLQQVESCYFYNDSRTFNIYDKTSELNNHLIPINNGELQIVTNTIRIEIQLEAKAISNHMRNSQSQNKRNLLDFLDASFSYGYLAEQIKAVFGIEKYICRTEALQRINQGSFRRQTKAILSEIINAVYTYGGLYHLEKAIVNKDKSIPPYFGDLQNFRKLLKKIRSLGFHPATIPDSFVNSRYSELPSLYELLQSTRKGVTVNGNKNNSA